MTIKACWVSISPKDEIRRCNVHTLSNFFSTGGPQTATKSLYHTKV